MTIVLAILWILGQIVCGFGCGAFFFLAGIIGTPTLFSLMLVLTGWADNFKMWVWLLRRWPFMVLATVVCVGMMGVFSLALIPPIYPFAIGILAGGVITAGLLEKWNLV